jgi:hypothetical protein
MNSQKVSTFHHKSGGWRAARYLVIALALGGWLTGTAFAQQEEANASETSKPVSAATSSATKASTPAPKSTSSDSTARQDFPEMKDDLTAPPPGVNVGNYNIKSSIDLGWRYNDITGSQNNYDTMVNLHQGPRLFDFSFNAHSINHDGALFDTMTFNGFGFGGDPDDVVRMRMTKNKWYNFDGTYRRDKYFWNYNLLDNPLNPVPASTFPAGTAVPSVTINYSPHALDLTRRMTNLNLTILPQSRVSVRLGYAHELLQGPSLSSVHFGTEPLLFQDWKNTTNIYHAGFDFHFLQRTTLSYDQFVQHFKSDTSFADSPDNNPNGLFNQLSTFGYQLSNGVPVDLGITPQGSPTRPCVTGPTTTPPTASPTACSAYLSYTRNGRPRVTIPTERFSFQSSYFHNFTMNGNLSYSSADSSMKDYAELFNGLETRTNGRGDSVNAQTFAKEVLVNGNWTGVYQVTSKFRILDTFNYNTYRLPGQYDFLDMGFFLQAPQNGQSGMLLPFGQFNSTDCPPPFTAATCPQHSSSSAADMAVGTTSNFLGQEIRTNTFQLSYDFTPHIGGHVGYRYLNRKIHDSSATLYSAEIYYPGGTVGANRGDCNFSGTGPVPASFPVFTSDEPPVQRGTCTIQADGSRVFVGAADGNDTMHNLAADINGNSALAGIWVRPQNNLRASFNVELFSADQAFTRITPRLLRHYQFNTTYTPVNWAEITGDVDIVDSSDNVTYVSDVEHNRSYSISTVFTPNSRLSFDLSYNYNDIYTQAFDCWPAAASPVSTNVLLQGNPNPTPLNACPAAIAQPTAAPYGGMSIYMSKSNFAYADMMVKPTKQLTFDIGYAGSFVRGTTSWINSTTLDSVPFLNPLTPYGPLRFNYQLPYIRMTWNVYRGLSYVASWNYYGYNTRGDNNPAGLIPLGTQDFNGNNMTMSAKYSF